MKDKIKRYVWLYLILLIFEGALRKWILPSLATPLLIIRDPIAVYIIFYVIRYKLVKINSTIYWIVAITILSFFISMLAGHGNFIVALYGSRIYLLHFPLIFIIGQLLDKDDVLLMGKFIMYLVIPMSLLTIAQFYSPQSAFVNRGIGGDMKGAGFGGALGFLRPPGTFSFTNGLVLFFGLSYPIIFNEFLSIKKSVDKILLIFITFFSIIAIPFTISRTLLFSFIISLVFLFLIKFDFRNLLKTIFLLIPLILLLNYFAQFQFIEKGLEVFEHRFTGATKTEGGFVEGTISKRFFGGFIDVFNDENFSSLLGKGIGMGTNVGARELSDKKETFLIAENEWPRIIGEMGLILGLFVILIRIQIAVKLLKSSLEIKNNNNLPWLLMSFCFINMLQSQWAQPTSLGFSVLTAGLVIASLKKNEA